MWSAAFNSITAALSPALTNAILAHLHLFKAFLERSLSCHHFDHIIFYLTPGSLVSLPFQIPFSCLQFQKPLKFLLSYLAPFTCYHYGY